MIIAQKITNQALLLRKCGFDERAEMLEDYVAEIDLASNVAVLELMRPEIFNNVLLDYCPCVPGKGSGDRRRGKIARDK